jgi:hypothetical protein
MRNAIHAICLPFFIQLNSTELAKPLVSIKQLSPSILHPQNPIFNCTFPNVASMLISINPVFALSAFSAQARFSLSARRGKHVAAFTAGRLVLVQGAALD